METSNKKGGRLVVIEDRSREQNEGIECLIYKIYVMNNTYLSILILALLSLVIFACGGDASNNTEKRAAPKKATYDSNAKNENKKEVTTANGSGATPAQLEKAKEIIASVDAAVVGAVDGKKKFKLFCATCHGFKGDLNVNGAKDLSKSKISLAESVAQVYHGKGLMTPFQGILKDEEIVAVSKYIETLRK